MPSTCKTCVFVLVLAQLAATNLWVGWVGAVDWSSQLLSKFWQQHQLPGQEGEPYSQSVLAASAS